MIRDTWRAVLVVATAALLREIALLPRPAVPAATPAVATNWQAPPPTVATGWQQAEIVLARNLGARDPRDVLLRVEDASGVVVHRSAHWPNEVTVVWPAAPGPVAGRADPREFPPTREAAPEFRLDPSLRALPPAVAITGFRSGGLGWRMAVATTAERRVAVAMSLSDVDADLAALRNAFLFAVPVAFVLIGLGSWLVASRALRPVRRAR